MRIIIVLFILITPFFTFAVDPLKAAQEAYGQRQKELSNFLHVFLKPIQDGANQEVIVDELIKKPGLKIEDIFAELELTDKRSTSSKFENLQLRIDDVNTSRAKLIDLKVELSLKAKTTVTVPKQPAPEQLPKKDFFSRLFSRSKPKITTPKTIKLPGVATDPVGVVNLGLDLVEFKIAQAVANKCHRIIIGQINDNNLTKEECEKIIKEIAERPQFMGLDPLKQPGGDLFEVPEGYYKNWLGFYVRTPEKIRRGKRVGEMMRMN